MEAAAALPVVYGTADLALRHRAKLSKGTAQLGTTLPCCCGNVPPEVQCCWLSSLCFGKQPAVTARMRHWVRCATPEQIWAI